MSQINYIGPQQETLLYDDVCQIIDGARGRIATFVNTEACLTNWYVGKRIKDDVLYNSRAEYGKRIVINLSVKLTQRYGNGWSEKTLRHCLRAAETFSEEDIVSATQRQLTWTHLKSLMYIKNPLERQFYAQMCSIEHWGQIKSFFQKNSVRLLLLPENTIVSYPKITMNTNNEENLHS
ncbi:MAG: hypothetical protein IJQ59_05930 [Bacteroidaceae bacterium]|nr:hypothetical protein [Bacteroidaceae bacterium]